MENTALNDTTITTKDHEDWKKKKGYGPIIVAVSLALLLGLSFYTGGPIDGGTNLHHSEMGTKDAAASSSSMSLVGSGTAKSSAYCKKNTGYNCGAVFPLNGNTCSHKGCCCRQQDGTGYKMNTCDNAKGYAYRGCNSCWGTDACFNTNNINAGTSSCHGYKSCNDVSDSTIGNDSCHGINSCKSVQNSTIQHGSCRCDDGDCCDHVKNSIIGKGSCNDGRGSRQWANGHLQDTSCGGLKNVKIGNNSCNNGENSIFGVCVECKHNVPDNACNTGITDDMDPITGYCNYCL